MSELLLIFVHTFFAINNSDVYRMSILLNGMCQLDIYLSETVNLGFFFRHLGNGNYSNVSLFSCFELPREVATPTLCVL